MRKIILSVAILMASVGMAKADILTSSKDFVNAVKPNAGYLYDFINHEGVQFYSRNVVESGKLRVPFGYTSTDGLAIGAAYSLLTIKDVPVFQTINISPLIAVGMKDISNIFEKPSSLSKNNFSLNAGINIEF